MPEVITPPDGQDTGKVKTADEIVAEVKAENEKLSKQLKDKDEFIGRQSTEIGELRKKSVPEPKSTQDKDELVEGIYEDLRKDGLDEETARYNAKILAKSGIRVIDKRLNERMMSEVVDLVEEAMEEKKIDEGIYKENEADILSEFQSRKLAPTARKNYKLLRECYDNVVRRKAETLRTAKEQEDAKKRDDLIAAGGQPPAGGRNVPSGNEDKTPENIRNAGANRGSAFF
jgi:hypothetical protein